MVLLQPLPRIRVPAAAAVRAASVASLLLGLAGLAAAPAARAEDAVEKLEKTYDLGGVNKVRLQNVNGSVHVFSWDKGTFRLEATKRCRGSRTEACLKETEIKVVKVGPTIDVETILPKQGGFFGFLSGSRGAEVSYEIWLPAAVVVDIETVNGRILAEKRGATLSLNTVNGSVRVEQHDAALKVNTVNGSVEVGFAGTLRPAEVETVNGSVTVSCSKASSIQYELQTVNGRIRSDFTGLTVEGKWGPKEARGTYNGGRDRLAVETVNGEVRLLALDEKGVAAPVR